MDRRVGEGGFGSGHDGRQACKANKQKKKKKKTTTTKQTNKQKGFEHLDN